MFLYPIIDKPNETVTLDFSKIDTENFAESEILVVIRSNNTIVYLPQAIQIKGSPAIYVLVAGDHTNSKIRVQFPDSIKKYPANLTEITLNTEYSMLKLKKVAVAFAMSNQGLWMLEAHA